MAETCFCRTGLNRFKPRFKPPLAETCQPCLQTQIQGLSRTMSVFKDFPGLENLEKKFKNFQGPARARIYVNYCAKFSKFMLLFHAEI